jgi:NADH-quinone oxidoreductase subunit E
MAVRRLAEKHLQPSDFAFTAENLAWARTQIAKYPDGRQASAVIPILWKAQEQAGGWVPEAAIRAVGELLGMAYIRVLEVATFYTMFNLAPVGRHHVQLCGTTPCALRGAEALKRVCHERIGEQFHVTDDGNFSWVEVECLGACVNAPMAQINYDFYEDLTPESFNTLLDDLAAGRPVKTGPQIERQFSAPSGGPTTLTDPSLYPVVPDDEPAPGTHTHAGEPVEDEAAKRPGVPASIREAPGYAENPQAEVEDHPPPSGTEAAEVAPRDREALAREEEAEIAAKIATLGKDASAEQKADAVGTRPQALASARGDKADDLKRIKGIGPVNEGKLNALGVFHFDQIAAWGRAEIRWVGTYLAFPGRIDREDWVGQARTLAARGDTEFSRRGDGPQQKA